MTTIIKDFETAQQRVAEIKAEVSGSKKNAAATGVHFLTGITLNATAITLLLEQADALAKTLGILGTAASLAASGFSVSHMIWDYFLNQEIKKRFLNELSTRQDKTWTPSPEEISKLFDQAALFPPQYYPYLIIVGAILFFGLNTAALFLPMILAALPAAFIQEGLNIVVGGVFTAGGKLFHAGVPNPFMWLVSVANAFPLLAKLLPTEWPSWVNNLIAPSILAGVGGVVAKVTIHPLKSVLGFFREKCCSKGYEAIPEVRQLPRW